jgi:hypothetical protein
MMRVDLLLPPQYGFAKPVLIDRYTTTPEKSVEFTGLLDFLPSGNCRRDDGNILLDYEGEIKSPNGGLNLGEILLFDPALLEYPRVQVVGFELTTLNGEECRPDCRMISENELVVSRDSLVRFSFEHGYSMAIAEIVKQATDGADKGASKGGRPPEYLMEALKHAYQQCYDRGDTSILEPGQLPAFLKHLQKLSGGSRKKELVSEYIKERIELVQPSNSVECVKTYERAVDGKLYKKSGWYSQNDISTRMNTLRKKYPLSPQNNIQKPVISESENLSL